MTVVYIDSVFVLNAVMDYLLCLLTARFAGVPLRRLRYALAALLGGLYAAGVFLPGCGFLSKTLVKVAVGALMALIAFGGEERLLRLMLLFFSMSCGLAGCILGLGLLAGSGVPQIGGVFYTNVNGESLLLGATGVYVLVRFVFHAAARHGLRGELLPVRLSIGGKVLTLTALWDSGNHLREPGGGKEVLVVSSSVLHSVLPYETAKLLTEAALHEPAGLLEPLMKTAPQLRPRLIPYHAVGTSAGLLLAVRTDWAEIGGRRYPGLAAALSPGGLGNGYSALWGGEVRKEGA